MNFRATVGISHPCAAVVVIGGQINPLIDIRSKESAVIDTIRVFIQRQPCLRRLGIQKLGQLSHFDKSDIGRA